MSTPAANDRRMRASTVFDEGSRMSTSRLWVRISNCSRLSLSMNGERRTVNFSIRVGSGTGPTMSAPVRWAVSTIWAADWSSSRWSYALRRIRIRCFAMSGADARDRAGADGPATLADGEALADLEGDRGDELDAHLDVVAGHDHLGALGQPDGPGDVGRAQVELRPVAVVEGGMAAALLLGQDVDLRRELGVGLDRARLGQDLAALDLLALDAPDEAADVVAGLALLEQLLEHLDAGHDDLAGRLDADELDLVADLDDAPLDAARRDRAPALDAEDVLDRHEEGLVDRALRGRDVRVDRVHQLLDGLVGLVRGVVGRFERLQRRAADDRDVVTREVVLGQELADLELDEVEQLLVVDHVDLVEEDDHVRDLDLTGEQDVLAGLGHRSVGRGDDQDGAVHLGGSGDHVLDVVGVTRAVDVGVVAGVGLVLDVGDGDGDATLTLLGRVVDRIEGAVLGVALQREVLRDRRGQARLAVVDVADRADVDVRLGALELLLGHETVSLLD